MKKYLLLFLMCVYASIGAWAVAVTVSTDNGLTTVTCSDNGESEVTVTGSFPAEGSISNIKVVGPFTTGVSDKIANAIGSGSSSFTRLDLSEATGVTTSTLSTYSIVTWSKMGFIKHLILPKGASVPTAEQLKSNASKTLDLWDAMEYFVIPQSDGSCDIYLTEAGLTSISDADIIIDNKSASTVTVHLAEGEDENKATEATKTTIENYLKTHGYKLFVAPYTVSGCNVSINMDGAEADQTLADLIATAKAKVTGSICTLTVAGELTDNDLIALGGTNMTGATRIDLSGATLASGVDLDYLQVPESLTSIVLPKNQTVNVGLAAKFADANLNYAYSPSTDHDEADPTVADYVWVNKAGGMAAALEYEASLTTSKYIKVASNEALNASDVNFSSTTALKYLDLRYANFTPAVSSSFKSSQAQGYRIILPDDWTEDEMNTFGETTLGSVSWAMAGIYSYSGTTLRIHELTDSKYMDTALSNPRIVYDGTTAIKIVGTRLGENLLAALNAAASSVKTITVTASSLNDLTFTNPNITTLNVTGLTLNTTPGRITVDDDCTSLTTLNVTDCSLMTVVATGVSSLTTVNLNGTTISGETNLSNTGLTTFTTNSSTKLQGDINLMSTALTSLNTTAEIGTTTAGTGNILLNGCESLASITLGSAQFKNGTSMIHIDKSTTENSENKDAIDLLSKTETVGESQVAVKTIFVPNGFTSSTRIHPYDEVKNNVSEVAGSSANEDGDGCSITYDATTKVATVHTKPGHFANMMETRYENYPPGATFKFDATSQINVADLQALAGKINANDYSWRTNNYYVDLYDLPATKALCDNTTGVIGQTIDWLRTNDRQFKGLILPKDHTQYGSGTTLIKDGAGTNTQLATCSEFIAYYKTKDEQGQDVDQKTFVGHVYNQSPTSADAYQASYEKMLSLVDAHTYKSGGNEVPEVKTDASIVLITSNSATKLNSSSTSISGSTRIETINNEMVGTQTGKASVYAYPNAPGNFAVACTSTGLPSTPTEMLQINGAISDNDIAAINSFTDGPRVLDLRYANTTGQTGMITKAMLEALTNKHIEYILLPEGQTKAVVCGSDYSDLTGLKAVISSTSTDLVAYVNKAGSLAEARYLATGGSIDEGTKFITPAQTGLKNVTLAGNLNAADIAANTTTHHVDKKGHWESGSANASSIALSGEQGTITTIDLKDAVFEEYTPTGGKLTSDMNFSYAGLGSIQNITLPTNEHMTLIPEDCFMGITSFDDLCIPYNYTHIDNAALNGTYCSHITTTDAKGALVDNGPKTYTFSKNLEEIGTEPDAADANGVHILSKTVFPQNRGVTDVYVLAHKVPKCYANAFPANMLYGWGGFKGGDFPYCREKYDNSSDGSLIFTVLHFPDEASFNASSDKETSYEQMKRYYTDVNKVYTKKEQTGAVDANGDPIAWPTFAELRRAYNQATAGAQWYDWNTEYDGQGSINGGNYIPVGTGEYDVVPTGTKPNTEEVDYDFSSYEGWHQFSLSMATYVEPDKNIVNNVVKNEYVEGAWYTLCIPFSLTEDQLIEMLGIPKSDDVEENYLDGVKVTTPMLPDLRTLRSVTRTPGTQNKVTLLFTNNLTMTRPGSYEYWNINDAAPNLSDYGGCGTLQPSGSKIAIKGGFPYLVKPYLPKDEVVKNLGKYIITHFGDQFTSKQSCMNIDFCYEDLATYSEDNKTGRFAKPFERHKIQAFLDYKDDTKNAYTKHADGTNYYYTFVGQFWTQPLPRYSFYMVENNNNTAGKWYLYSSGNKDYKWNAYKCIILVTQENDDTSAHPNSGKYRNNETGHSVYPVSSGTDAQGAYIFDKPLYIEFLDGRDDTDFADVYNGGGSAKYIFSFDDIIQELDENGNETTSIDSLDGVEINTLPDNYKVYNMSGQYVGNSINGLGKGLYIVNGKKIVVQ